MAGKTKPTVFTYRLNGTLTVAVWAERRRIRLGENYTEVAWGYEVKDGKTPLFKSKGVNQDTFELVTGTWVTSAQAAATLLYHLMPARDERLPASFQDSSKLTKRQLQWFLSDYRRYAGVQDISHLGQYDNVLFLRGDDTWVPLDEDGLPRMIEDEEVTSE